MGVGKSSVARHLSNLMHSRRVDLDLVIEQREGRTIAEIFGDVGETDYRQLETHTLKRVLAEPDIRIISLGGGTWTIAENRELISKHGVMTVWLESTFDHCWQNISKSRKERPLANNKDAARTLFDKRQAVYALADWHFIVKPEFTSYDIAREIADQVFS